MTIATNSEFVMPEGDARRLTEKIRLTAHTYAEAREKLIGYVEEAKSGNAHVALGYRSWTEYLAEVLGEEPMRLARDDRREVVALLSSEGMSTRAIAPIVGASIGTVHADRAEVFSSEHVPPASAESAPSPDEPEIDLANVDMATGEILSEGPVGEFVSPYTDIAEAAKKKVTGLDGKEYSRPEPQKPRRKPLTDAARDAGWELRKAVERLQRIAEDDRFSRNKEEVTPHLRGHLINAVEVCQDLLDQINPEGN